jgi:hypothetical protein
LDVYDLFVVWCCLVGSLALLEVWGVLDLNKNKKSWCCGVVVPFVPK